MAGVANLLREHKIAELESLQTLLSHLSGISGSIEHIGYEPLPDRVSMYKTMYSRPLADATGMAAVFGKNLGDIIAAEEPQDIFWSMSQMTDQFEPL